MSNNVTHGDEAAVMVHASAGRTGPPSFYCPIESAIHPRARQLEQRALAWIDSVGLCPDPVSRQETVGSNSAEAVCRISPNAPDEERLLLFIEWVYWGFAIDGQHEQTHGALSSAEVTGLCCRLMGCLDAPGARLLGDLPFAAALEDIVDRLRELATPTQMRRFTEAMRRYLMGVIWETVNRARGVIPSLQDFTVQRLSACGGPPVFTLAEFALGEEVPGHEFDAPAVRAAVESATFVTAVDNDIYSYAKEADQAQTPGQAGSGQNIIDVLAHHTRSADPVAEAMALRDRAMVFFLQQRDRLRAAASPALARFLDDLGHAIRSNIEWSHAAPRYHGDAELVPVTWASHPSDLRSGPLPIPALAWWWST